MKKIAFLLIAGGIFISSCKKTYTCTCTDTAPPGGGVTVFEIPDATQQQAVVICVSKEVYVQGTIQSRTCKL